MFVPNVYRLLSDSFLLFPRQPSLVHEVEIINFKSGIKAAISYNFCSTLKTVNMHLGCGLLGLDFEPSAQAKLM